jgi:hypothetical protein
MPLSWPSSRQRAERGCFPSSRWAALGPRPGRNASDNHGEPRPSSVQLRRGGPGTGAAGHDLCARAAPPTACPAAPAGLAPVAAPHQRTPVRRPLPVAANTRRLRQCPRRTPAARTAPPPGRGSGSTADTAAVSGSADTRSGVGTTTNGGQQPQGFRHRQSGASDGSGHRDYSNVGGRQRCPDGPPGHRPGSIADTVTTAAGGGITGDRQRWLDNCGGRCGRPPTCCGRQSARTSMMEGLGASQLSSAMLARREQ